MNVPTFGPNLNEFVRRFDAATTNGQGQFLSKPQLLLHPASTPLDGQVRGSGLETYGVCVEVVV